MKDEIQVSKIIVYGSRDRVGFCRMGISNRVIGLGLVAGGFSAFFFFQHAANKYRSFTLWVQSATLKVTTGLALALGAYVYLDYKISKK